MRVCVVGAGAIGGYFGGRLAEAGRDVTFLVRPARAARLAEAGLTVRSRFGDIHLPRPATVLADAIDGPFDLVILSCKAYDLDDAMASCAPAVGPDTTILPLLNGMAHLDRLDGRFGAARVIGGQCVIGVTLAPDGTITHLNDVHGLTFGERDGSRTDRITAIEETLAGANFAPRASDRILLEMWEKWVFLASLASGTSLMRAPVGDIVAAPGGREFMLGLFAEAQAIAAGLRLPGARRSRGAHTRHAHGGGLARHRLDGPRHRQRRADRGGPRRRRPHPARPRGRPGARPVRDGLHAPQGLRGGAGAARLTVGSAFDRLLRGDPAE